MLSGRAAKRVSAQVMAGSSDAPSTEIRASFVLLGATVLALILANSGLAGAYKGVLEAPVAISAGGWDLTGPVKDWIKNALMAVFFLVVAGQPAFTEGWAIPAATDIAFAVGVVGLLGARVPATLKAFLLAVAVIDDVGAILIIALFYTAEVHLWALTWVAVTLAALLALNLAGVRRLGPYMLLGLVLWVFFMESGISATLAGVLLALFIPLKVRDRTPPDSLMLDPQAGHSPLHVLMARLKFSVLFVIMPVFALANAGVPLGGIGWEQVAHPVTAGIALGLFLGKPLGIVGAVMIVRMLGIARLPDGATWPQMLGIAWIAGIGFTMSLFIGVLAFDGSGLLDQVRLGVLLGSTAAALMGAAVIALAAGRSIPAAAVIR